MLEKELKILEIDDKKIIEKLEKLGAKKIFDGDIHDVYYDWNDVTLDNIKMCLRIRKKDDKHLYTIKKKMKNKNIKECIEIEHPIECIDTYKNRLDKHGLEVNREKKKHRISYQLGDVVFDIDYYDEFPPLLEIEAPKEENIFEWIKVLGLENNIQKKFGYRGLCKYYENKKKTSNT